jgi:hypothetical protein
VLLFFELLVSEHLFESDLLIFVLVQTEPRTNTTAHQVFFVECYFLIRPNPEKSKKKNKNGRGAPDKPKKIKKYAEIDFIS